MEELLALITKTYGLVGLLMLFPFAACYFLWKENKRLTTVIQTNAEEGAKHLQESNDRVVEATKQRVVDAQAVTSKLVELVSEQSASSKETNLALDHISEILSGLKGVRVNVGGK